MTSYRSSWKAIAFRNPTGCYKITEQATSAESSQPFAFAPIDLPERAVYDLAYFWRQPIDNIPQPIQETAKQVHPFACQIGTLSGSAFDFHGCATFIADNVLVTANHVVESIWSSRRLAVRFTRGEFWSPEKSYCSHLTCGVHVKYIRRLPKIDVCILFLDSSFSAGSRFQFPMLTDAQMTATVMLIHPHPHPHTHTHRHPRREVPVVSIAHKEDCPFGEQIATQIVSDGGPGTCGAAIFNENGRISGIFIGAEVSSREVKLVRTINDVIFHEMITHGDSILRHYVSNVNEDRALHDWVSIRDGYVKEGVKFTKALQDHKYDERAAVLACLGIGGLYYRVQRYSCAGHIEGDHFPPCWAYRLSKTYEGVNTTRLPVISLPYSFHRKFITTGKCEVARTFAEYLSRLMDEGRFATAIWLNIVEYDNARLFENGYWEGNFNLSSREARVMVMRMRNGICDALKEHENLKFITVKERQTLQKWVTEEPSGSFGSMSRSRIDACL